MLGGEFSDLLHCLLLLDIIANHSDTLSIPECKGKEWEASAIQVASQKVDQENPEKFLGNFCPFSDVFFFS